MMLNVSIEFLRLCASVGMSYSSRFLVSDCREGFRAGSVIDSRAVGRLHRSLLEGWEGL